VCCQVSRSRCRADHLSRGLLSSVVCLGVIAEPQREGVAQAGMSSHEKIDSSYEKQCMGTIKGTYRPLRSARIFHTCSDQDGKDNLTSLGSKTSHR
jgi:hypothetical protein